MKKTVQTAQNMGLASIDDKKNDYGLSLALGAAEVTPLQMTNAYAAFANGGMQHDTSIVRSINSKYGEKIFETKKSDPKQVVSPQGAFLLSNILSDNAARSAVFGSSLNVYDAKTRAVKTVAVKTGTTNDSRDAWTMGYTPQMAIGVWVGNNDNSQMSNGGSIMAGPIFTKAMGSIMAGIDTKFPSVDGVVQKNICNSNHGVASEAVKGSTYSEWFLSTALPTATCSAKVTPSPSPTPTPSNNPTNALSMTLTASPSTSANQGTSVTFTAALSSASAIGSVQFLDGSQVIGSGTVTNGSASVTTALLSAGQHTITATFMPADADGDTISATMPYQINSANGQANGRGGLFN